MKRVISLLIIAVFIAVPSANAQSTSFLTGGSLAGQPLSASQWSISVDPGALISGNVLLQNFNAHRPGAVVPFGYTWTWGPRESSIVTVSNWISTGTTDWNVPISLTAPDTPGEYYLLFGHRGEFNLSQVFSATNWMAGPVVWHDGNDYHDMDPVTLQFAHDNGYAHKWSYLFSDGYRPTDLAVMPIKVNVVPEPSAIMLVGTSLVGLIGAVRRRIVS